MFLKNRLNRNIFLMYVITLLQGMVFYGSVSTLYRQAAGISLFQITLIESISMILTILLEIPWGIVADKIGYKKTFVLCSVLFFLSKLVFWRADSFGAFLFERILLAAVLAGLSGVETSLLYLSAKGRDTQKIFGINSTLSVVGLFLASGMYSLCIGDNYRRAGFLTALCYGAAALLSLGITEVKEREEERKQKSGVRDFLSLLPKVFREKENLYFLLGMALVSEVHQMTTVVLNQPQFQACGASGRQIALLFLLLTAGEMAGGLSSWITGKIGEKSMLICGFLIPGICCLVLAGTKSLWISVLAVLLIQISFSLLSPLQTELQNRMALPGYRAIMLSVYAVFMDGTAAGVDLLFGRIADFSLPLAMAFGSICCVIGLLLYFRGEKGKQALKFRI